MKESFGYLRSVWRKAAVQNLPKILSWVLIFALCTPVYSTSLVRASEPGREGGLCEHHPEHTAECGYAPGTDGTPCTHEHDDTCGYTAPVEGAPCTHEHDDTCGYVPGTDEIPCDKGCEDTDGDGETDHSPDCAYTPGEEGAPCTHEHDDTCGYIEPEEGAPCTHEHDDTCGYAPGEQGSPCTFICELCPAPVSGVIASWEWAEEGAAPQWNEDAGCYALAVSGAGEEAPLTAEMLRGLLPEAVDALLEIGRAHV